MAALPGLLGEPDRRQDATGAADTSNYLFFSVGIVFSWVTSLTRISTEVSIYKAGHWSRYSG